MMALPKVFLAVGGIVSPSANAANDRTIVPLNVSYFRSVPL